jgi:hypothetical protein
MAIFLIWLTVAEAIYIANFGYAAPASIGQFADEVFTTSAGWKLIIVGTSVGFLFAVLTLTISAVSFPVLLDRDVGAAVALLTSIRVVAANPVTMALWGLIVTALLVIGLVPFFSASRWCFRCSVTRRGISIARRSNRTPIPTRTISRDRRTTGPLRISPPCSSRRGGRRCRLRLGVRRLANALKGVLQGYGSSLG